MVEVRDDEATAAHRIECVAAYRLRSRQVLSHHRVAHGYEVPVTAFVALHLRLLAEASPPFVGTRGGVPGPFSVAALPALGEQVIPARESGAEEGDLVGRGERRVARLSIRCAFGARLAFGGLLETAIAVVVSRYGRGGIGHRCTTLAQMPELRLQRRSLCVDDGETGLDAADPFGVHGGLLVLRALDDAAPRRCIDPRGYQARRRGGG